MWTSSTATALTRRRRLEETMTALDHVVRQGKALYAGISSYQPEDTRRARKSLRELGTPCLIHQPSYSMFRRWVEDGLLDVLDEEGMGVHRFFAAGAGIANEQVSDGVPDDSRAAKDHGFLQRNQLTEETLSQVRRLNELPMARGQTLAQMAVAWVLRHPGMTSALVGASRVSQIEDNVAALSNLEFAEEELRRLTIISLSR